MAVKSAMQVNPIQFGARLRNIREAVGLTQAELARRIDVSKQTLASWETGHRTPNFIDVVRCASVLGRNVEDFAVIPDVIPERKMGRPAKPKPADDDDETAAGE